MCATLSYLVLFSGSYFGNDYFDAHVYIQVSGLLEGELYTFYVQAVNAYGTSGASPAVTVVAALPAGIVTRRPMLLGHASLCIHLTHLPYVEVHW